MGEAFITRRGGGGAAGLNFRVIGGTTQPSNPKKNDIWVNTGTDISSYDFSAEMPFLRSNNKNKIVYPFYNTTKTENGITWTDNKDGSITANGTAAGAGLFRVSAFDGAADHEFLEAGTYTLSGCPAGGGASTYLMELFIINPVTLANEAIGRDYGNGLTFTLEHDCKVRVNLNIMSGTTVNRIVFKPQIEKGSAKTAFVKGDATGQVWISTGTSSIMEFNALKKNGIQVYPISAKQYIGGAWVDKTAKSYQGGVWCDWMYDLYMDGGEWQARGLAPDSGWPLAYTPAVTKNTDGSTTVSVTVSGEGGGGVWDLKNDIDVTNYTALCIKCKVSLPSRTEAGVCAHLAVIPRNASYWTTNAAAIRTLPSTNNGITTYELDISSLRGTYDIAVCGRWNGAWLGVGTVAVTVYDIYLM